MKNMGNENAPKYTKDDFLDYRKLAEKLGRDPDEVYRVMLRHWKAQTPLKYNSHGGQMIIAKTPTKPGKSRTSAANRHALLLHPMGYEKFVQELNKGK